jgi:hypothetical protein
MTAKINEHVRSAVCFYVIHGDDCNGESRQFESFLRREYPNVAIDYIEHVSGLGAGLFDENGLEIFNTLWDEYCDS